MIYHTSPAVITKENKFGLFGSALCFSSNRYVMTAADAVVVYSLDLENLNIIEECAFSYLENDSDIKKLYPVIAEIAETFSTDSDTARDLLDGSKNENDLDSDFDTDEMLEKSFWLQKTKYEAARLLGFDGVETVDEQGAMWMLPASMIVNQTPRPLSDFE